MLQDYEPPPMDGAKDQELSEWIQRQKASFPDSNV
jgi:trimethylamine:corrinoid methyltransferase-like protein